MRRDRPLYFLYVDRWMDTSGGEIAVNQFQPVGPPVSVRTDGKLQRRTWKSLLQYRFAHLRNRYNDLFEIE